MAKSKLTAQQLIEKHLKAIKKIKDNEKKKLAQVPLDFATKLEKIWNKKLTEKEYTAIYDLIKQNKTTFDKCITPASTTASNTATTQKSTTSATSGEAKYNATYGTQKK